MDHFEDVSGLMSTKNHAVSGNANAESGLINLIEAAELLRRNKIATNLSYTETFFSAAKQFLG
jgi:hypothetical protein